MRRAADEQIELNSNKAQNAYSRLMEIRTKIHLDLKDQSTLRIQELLSKEALPKYTEMMRALTTVKELKLVIA